MRRTLLGMTQTKLGDAIGLTFQQVQKYERGVNRIGSSRLYDLARVLDVPINFFFDEMPTAVSDKSPARASGKAETLDGFDPDLVSKRETLELVRAYYKISNPQVRRRLFEMVKALGVASGA
jgi:transcriptional regulator with XRE-family HTH domain